MYVRNIVVHHSDVHARDWHAHAYAYAVKKMCLWDFANGDLEM